MAINEQGFLKSIKKRIMIKRVEKKPMVKKTELNVKSLPWEDQQQSIYSNTTKGREQKKKDIASDKQIEDLKSVERSKKKRKQRIRNTMTNTIQDATVNPQSKAFGYAGTVGIQGTKSYKTKLKK